MDIIGTFLHKVLSNFTFSKNFVCKPILTCKSLVWYSVVLFAVTCVVGMCQLDNAFATSPSGIIVPLYSFPGTTWDKLIQEKNTHRSIPIIAIINPSNGPGIKDQNYVIGVQKLQNAGIVVLGYVYTQHVDVTEIRNDIDEYKNWYSVNGIFFDAMSNVPGSETFYKQLNDYAKSMGLTYTVGNPGADTLPSYVGTVDNIVIHDNKNVPALSLLDGWHENFTKKNFSSISYGVNSINKTYVTNATKHVQYLYITNLTLPNPFYDLPSYVDEFMNMMEEGQQNNDTVSVTINAYSDGDKPLNGLWTTVKSATNSSSGFTPFSFIAIEGQPYTITVSNFGNHTFEHWDDNTTDNTRTIIPTQNTTISAYYGVNPVIANQTIANQTGSSVILNQTQASSIPIHSVPLQGILTNQIQNTGSVAVSILYLGGDRADYSLLSFKIYQDANKTVYREIDSVSGNPFNINDLPMGHRYKVEVFANGMCSDIEYVYLETHAAQLSMYLPFPGGMRLHIFYNDGYTPISNAIVSVKSQDNKTWATSTTDTNGETLRFWLEPTVVKNDYFVVQTKIGQHISYSYSPVFLYPGYAQEIGVTTPWPTTINSAIKIKVYDSQSNLYSPKAGDNMMVGIFSNDNKISESTVTARGEVDFANLKVGDYMIRAFDTQSGVIWGESHITLDGSKTTFAIHKNIVQNNQTSVTLANQEK